MEQEGNPLLNKKEMHFFTPNSHVFIDERRHKLSLFVFSSLKIAKNIIIVLSLLMYMKGDGRISSKETLPLHTTENYRKTSSHPFEESNSKEHEICLAPLHRIAKGTRVCV
ncbi:MAG: hypothetical protein LBG18_02480 [Mediterranea sp.]|jgi:hypothetical protein|nr:hypothetical protein [Mediterranea sp.]